MRTLLAAAVLAVVALAACATSHEGPNGQVDGWSIGEVAQCQGGDAPCRLMVQVATERLASRDLGHAHIVQATLHEEGLYPNRDGELGQIFYSGGSPSVVLFQLADGSRRAIGVKYVLRDEIPTTYDHGPERRPGRGADGTPAPTI
jgi:hypothetical protein